MPPEAPLLEAVGVAKGFGETDRMVLFSGLDLSIAPGEFLSIIGPSGCGKSTLLHLLAGLDEPDGGTIRVGGADWKGLSPEAAARRRGESIGFVFQLHHLLPELTAEENVALPLFLAGASEKDGRRVAREALDRVGLSARAAAFPRTLSGGERQRVAIARAVVRRPRVLLCDEPTGSLDVAHAEAVFALLTEVARERAGSVVLVTHDPSLARRCERSLRLTIDGLVPEEKPPVDETLVFPEG